MKRTDLEMTETLRNFLNFDLGHMHLESFPTRQADIPYTKENCLDLYYPQEKKDSYPLVIVIYGGGWVSGFKEDKFVEPMIEPIHQGYAVAVPDYTLALDDVWPRQVVDLKTSILFLKEHARQYHLDPSRITLWGESAGAHLALLAGTAEDAAFGLQGDTTVQNIIAYYPLTDIDTIEAQARQLNCFNPATAGKDSMTAVMMGPHYNDPLARQAASPVHWLHPGMPKVYLEHGTGDELLPYLQSKEYFEKAAAMGLADRVSLRLAAAKKHTDPWFFSENHVASLFQEL